VISAQNNAKPPISNIYKGREKLWLLRLKDEKEKKWNIQAFSKAIFFPRLLILFKSIMMHIKNSKERDKENISPFQNACYQCPCRKIEEKSIKDNAAKGNSHLHLHLRARNT
jgi:hypothetical protein